MGFVELPNMRKTTLIFNVPILILNGCIIGLAIWASLAEPKVAYEHISFYPMVVLICTSIVTAVSTLPLVALTLAHKHYNRVARICISSIIVLPSYFASIAFFFLAAHTAYLSPRYRNVLDGSCSAVKTGTPATCIHQWKRLAYLEITLVVFTTVAALLALVELVVAIIHQTRLKRQCTQTDVLLSSLPHEHKQYDFLNG